MSGPVDAAEQAAESVRAVNHLTLRAPSPGTPGWEDVGDLYRVLDERQRGVADEMLPATVPLLADRIEMENSRNGDMRGPGGDMQQGGQGQRRRR